MITHSRGTEYRQEVRRDFLEEVAYNDKTD